MFNNVHTTPTPSSAGYPSTTRYLIHPHLTVRTHGFWLDCVLIHPPPHFWQELSPWDHFYLHLLNSSSPSKFIWIPPISCHMLFSPFIHDSPDHHILSSPQPWGQHRCKQQVLHTWLINEGINDNLLLGSMAYIPHISKS